jgi:hypothetical protein
MADASDNNGGKAARDQKVSDFIAAYHAKKKVSAVDVVARETAKLYELLLAGVTAVACAEWLRGEYGDNWSANSLGAAMSKRGLSKRKLLAEVAKAQAEGTQLPGPKLPQPPPTKFPPLRAAPDQPRVGADLPNSTPDTMSRSAGPALPTGTPSFVPPPFNLKKF